MDGTNKTQSVPSLSGLASAKVYSNMISHYITEAGTKQPHPHCSMGAQHTRTLAAARLHLKAILLLFFHIRTSSAEKKAFLSNFSLNSSTGGEKAKNVSQFDSLLLTMRVYIQLITTHFRTIFCNGYSFVGFFFFNALSSLKKHFNTAFLP